MAEEYPDADPEMVTTFLDVQWAYREMQKQYDAVLARFGLTESRFIILVFLSHAENQQLSPSDIADKLGASRATVTKLVKGMTDNGWTRKVGNLDDRRASLVQMTAAGGELLRKFLPHNFRSINTLLGSLSIEERATLRELLNKISVGTTNLKKDIEK